MKFIKKWVVRIVNEANRETVCEDEGPQPKRFGFFSVKASSVSSGHSKGAGISAMRYLEGNCTNFSVFKADGGFVIQYQAPYNDRIGPNVDQGPKLRIVNSNEDLGQAITHIMTLQALNT